MRKFVRQDWGQRIKSTIALNAPSFYSWRTMPSPKP